jgi:dolichyl-phosphooligosaccharide-protein glycotransferase
MSILKLTINKVDPMVSLNLKNPLTYLVAGLVIFFSLFALWIRIIPMFGLGHADILTAVGSDDPLYNLRQVEQILANFPNYAWFDPMTYFPSGSFIYWGPLFPAIIAIVCMITGSVTRPEIIATGLLIPPLMAALIVAIMYFVGKICGDWKTGLFASGLTAVVTGQFFYRSLYGYMDHHIAEVLFSTLFCLFYMYAIVSEKNTFIDLKKIVTYKKTIIVSIITGFAYLLGLFTMPTMILFALIVGIFTVIQFVIDVYRKRTSEYLLVINSIIFAIAIFGLLIFGFKTTGMELNNYSVGHILAYLALIGGTWALYILSRILKEKAQYYYPAVLAGFALLFSLILFFISPQIFNVLIASLFAFFGQAAITNTVQEARGWALDLAWATFNYGLILMAGGALVMLYNNIRDEHPHQIFALVWSLVMLFSTWQHVRYEYYLAVNIALLSAVCISFTVERGWKDIKKLLPKGSREREDPTTADSDREAPSRTKKQRKPHKKGPSTVGPDYIMTGLLILTAGLAIMFAFTSLSYSYSNAVSNPIQMNGDWKESLEWMGNNTPDTGVNYFTIYDPKTFEYPSQAYGVMSWWDYGHMITYIAKRIPNSNPFQQGVEGRDGAAAYFITTSEDTADTILDHEKTRYVITDIEMDTGKFWAMATWYNTTLANGPYQMTLLTQGKDDPNALQSVLLNNQQYYLTMVSRLHNFDGSMTRPSSAYYIEYADPQITKVAMPVITAAEAVNASEAQHRADLYNLGAAAGYHATVLSPSITLPIETVPALRHYRLVHESSTNVFNTATPDVKYVKIFEYVKGAHIKGDGIIEVPVLTNTGRSFTYRQESVNGEFIVPYSTSGNSYGIKTVGKYQIVGTGRQFDVPESAVMNGSSVQ